VTHSLDMVTRFCDEALWLDHGLVRAQGDPRRVVDAYLLDVAAAENRALHRNPAVSIASTTEQPEDMMKAVEGRWGSREAEIASVEFVRSDGVAAHVFESGEPLAIRMGVRAHHPLNDFVFGVALFSAEGVCCYGTNTDIEGAEPHEFTGEAEVGFVIDSLCLVAGTYTVDVAVHRRNGVPYDYHRSLYTIRVTSRVNETGIVRPPHRWTFSSGIRISGL
jgi:ABC-type polysaccharide/polyol phosphate transport system, ATPase component